MRPSIMGFLALSVLSVWSQSTAAAVDHIEILDREPVAGGAEFGAAGGYEKLRGRAWFALDPGAPADLVLYGADPRSDLEVLRHPALILMDGQVIGSHAGLAMRD